MTNQDQERINEIAIDCADDYFRSVIEGNCTCFNPDEQVYSIDHHHMNPYSRTDVDLALEWFTLRSDNLPYTVIVEKELKTIQFKEL